MPMNLCSWYGHEWGDPETVYNEDGEECRKVVCTRCRIEEIVCDG